MGGAIEEKQFRLLIKLLKQQIECLQVIISQLDRLIDEMRPYVKFA